VQAARGDGQRAVEVAQELAGALADPDPSGGRVAARAHDQVESLGGRPADWLLDLCEHVDLVVIGSRRWGAVARLMLGSTGEALMHDASCPVLVVPPRLAKALTGHHTAYG
jgi:nucleotide-binding universal stress UspA family protein